MKFEMRSSNVKNDPNSSQEKRVEGMDISHLLQKFSQRIEGIMEQIGKNVQQARENKKTRECLAAVFLATLLSGCATVEKYRVGESIKNSIETSLNPKSIAAAAGTAVCGPFCGLALGKFAETLDQKEKAKDIEAFVNNALAAMERLIHTHNSDNSIENSVETVDDYFSGYKVTIEMLQVSKDDKNAIQENSL